eukprot:Rhum_TRINITY_DN14827_c11_g1::Rhum_TRINITY_DN14827_c11_g1_i1::g.122102::m.122102
MPDGERPSRRAAASASAAATTTTTTRRCHRPSGNRRTNTTTTTTTLLASAMVILAALTDSVAGGQYGERVYFLDNDGVSSITPPSERNGWTWGKPVRQGSFDASSAICGGALGEVAGLSVDEVGGWLTMSCAQNVYKLKLRLKLSEDDDAVTGGSTPPVKFATKTTFKGQSGAVYGTALDVKKHVAYAAFYETRSAGAGWVVRLSYLNGCASLQDFMACKAIPACAWQARLDICVDSTSNAFKVLTDDAVGGALAYDQKTEKVYLSYGKYKTGGKVVSVEASSTEVDSIDKYFVRDESTSEPASGPPEKRDIGDMVYVNGTAFVQSLVHSDATSTVLGFEGATAPGPSGLFGFGNLPIRTMHPYFTVVDAQTFLRVTAEGVQACTFVRRGMGEEPACTTIVADPLIGAIVYTPLDDPPPTDAPPTEVPPTDLPAGQTLSPPVETPAPPAEDTAEPGAGPLPEDTPAPEGGSGGENATASPDGATPAPDGGEVDATPVPEGGGGNNTDGPQGAAPPPVVHTTVFSLETIIAMAVGGIVLGVLVACLCLRGVRRCRKKRQEQQDADAAAQAALRDSKHKKGGASMLASGGYAALIAGEQQKQKERDKSRFFRLLKQKKGRGAGGGHAGDDNLASLVEEQPGDVCMLERVGGDDDEEHLLLTVISAADDGFGGASGGASGGGATHKSDPCGMTHTSLIHEVDVREERCRKQSGQAGIDAMYDNGKTLNGGGGAARGLHGGGQTPGVDGGDGQHRRRRSSATHPALGGAAVRAQTPPQARGGGGGGGGAVAPARRGVRERVVVAPVVL